MRRLSLLLKLGACRRENEKGGTEEKEIDGEIGSKTRERGCKAIRMEMSLGEVEGRRCERLC